jgi:hypothetical protein
MYAQKRHWLDYDPVALAALVIGLGMIELLAMIIWSHWIKHIGQEEIASRFTASQVRHPEAPSPLHWSFARRLDASYTQREFYTQG